MCWGSGYRLPFFFHCKTVNRSTQRRIDLAQGLFGARPAAEADVERFVLRQNIEHYRELLKITVDPARRRQIEKLLVEEDAKLRKYDEDHKKK
jgi:hypothetical protein